MIAPRIAQIQTAVADRYHVPREMMNAPCAKGANARQYAWPRQVAMCLAVRLTDHSLVRIGQLFGGRDHTTVIHALAAVEKRRAGNPNLHQSLRVLTLSLVRPPLGDVA